MFGHPSLKGVIHITAGRSSLAEDVRRSEGEVMASPLKPVTLSADLLQALQEIKFVRRFPKGSTLVYQGSVVRGVYLVESGEVRVLLPT